MEEQDKGYQVNDRRRVNPDGTIKEEYASSEPAEEKQQQAAQQEEQQTAEPEQQASEQTPPIPDFDVYTLMGLMIGNMAEKAWECMGVRLAPGAKELKKDMQQAKLAVDTVAFLVDKLHPFMGEDERKAARLMVSDLQINFVKHSS